MTPEYLKHNEIDFEKWDACVRNSDKHLPYSFSWYLDIVNPEWEALIIGDYEKIFPLTFRSKARINYLYQPFFTQQLGVFGNNIFEQDVIDFIRSIPQKFKFIEINLNSNCKLNTKDFSVNSKVTHHLELRKNYPEIQNLYNENTKRNIRKAEKSNLKFIESNNIKSLIILFKANTGNKTDLKDRDYEMLEALMNKAIKNKSGQLYEVLDEQNNLEAGLFLLSSKNIIINLFNASSSSGKKKSAMFLLINEIIKLNAGSDKIFDFEGSEIPEVARFYKGFGGMPVLYPHIKLNRLPWPLKWIKE